jgi:hypothetical protein
VRDGGVVARLIRVQPPPRADRPLGTARGKIVMADDFDAPLELTDPARIG